MLCRSVQEMANKCQTKFTSQFAFGRLMSSDLRLRLCIRIVCNSDSVPQCTDFYGKDVEKTVLSVLSFSRFLFSPLTIDSIQRDSCRSAYCPKRQLNYSNPSFTALFIFCSSSLIVRRKSSTELVPL